MEKVNLLSYPRSGNTWCRYIIESLWLYKTCGYEAVLDVRTITKQETWRDSVMVFKRHNEIDPDASKIIYLERPKEEAVARHTRSWDYVGNEGQEPDAWEQCKAYYEQFDGPKTAITFDELLTDTRTVVDKLKTVLGEPVANVGVFVGAVKQHRMRCVKLYTEVGGAESFTYGITK